MVVRLVVPLLVVRLVVPLLVVWPVLPLRNVDRRQLVPALPLRTCRV